MTKRSGGSPCPICDKVVVDRLLHLRLDHSIRDERDFEAAMGKRKDEQARVRAFRTFAEQAKKDLDNGLISAEEYRIRVMSWSR